MHRKYSSEFVTDASRWWCIARVDLREGHGNSCNPARKKTSAEPNGRKRFARKIGIWMPMDRLDEVSISSTSRSAARYQFSADVAIASCAKKVQRLLRRSGALRTSSRRMCSPPCRSAARYRRLHRHSRTSKSENAPLPFSLRWVKRLDHRQRALVLQHRIRLPNLLVASVATGGRDF
jgi:hypothetical protein